MLLVLRDYRECLLRQHEDAWLDSGSITEFLENQSLEQPPSWYLANIQAFDAFPGPKHVVYYEDIANKPQEAILLMR